MATSNSTDFTVSRDQIIYGALRLCGALAVGETPQTAQREANEALNMLVKALQAEGMPLWAIEQYTLVPVIGTSSYTIGIGQTVDRPKPLKIHQAFKHDTSTNVDIPMRIITRDEYNRLGNKTTSGTPIQLYYDVQNTYGIIHVYPVPSSVEQTITIVYQRPFQDFDTSENTPDFPQEWFDTLKYGLAHRLSGEYGLTIEDRRQLQQEYIVIKQEALSFGTEEGSFYIVPREY